MKLFLLIVCFLGFFSLNYSQKEKETLFNQIYENFEKAEITKTIALMNFYQLTQMADRLTINQSEVLDTLYGGYVQTATEQFVSSFMGENEEGKAPEYNMDAVKGYLTQIMKGTDAETKIKLANGLVSIKGK